MSMAALYWRQVWDVDGKEYFDYLSAYSAVNQVC